MAEAIASYSLERKLDLAASYILSKDDSELRKVSPKLVKAKHMILDSNGVAQYKAGVEAIEKLNAIVVADKLYGEKAATKVAAGLEYGFKPLLDVMGEDAAALGLSSEMKLHEIYEKVVGNEGTELHRLVTEMAPYNEIIGAAKNCGDVELKGAARKVYDFDIGVIRAKREYMRKVSMPMLAASTALTWGLGAGIASAATLYMFSYSREAVQRITEAAPKAGPIGKKFAKALNKVETQIGKAGFSVPQLAILWGESAIGVPIPWGPVLGYTTGTQALIVAGNKAGSYWHKLAAFGAMLSSEMLKETTKNADIRGAWKNFWSGVKEKESKMEAEAQLEQGPEKTKRGWSARQMRHLNMLKFPVGKTKYVDIMKLGVGERLNEKEIIEEAGREFANEFGKRYSPAVCNAILKEYLPAAKVSEDELIEARGASRTVKGTTITESSDGARKFGKDEYDKLNHSWCERLANVRAGVLKKEKYLFDWNEIPGNDTRQLIGVLSEPSHAYTMKAPEVKKSDDGSTINVFTGENTFSFKLNDEKTQVNMKTPDGTNYELIVKQEGGKLSVYGGGCVCTTDDKNDTLAFYKKENEVWRHFGPARVAEVVLLHQDKLKGTSTMTLEGAIKSGKIVQFPKLSKGGIEDWDLQDYKVYVSDLLEKEVAIPVLYHELAAHVGNRLEAFETMIKLGDAISRQQQHQQSVKNGDKHNNL